MINLKAHLACLLCVGLWAGWITISRYGVHSSLLPADITLIRYWTALFCISPLLFTHSWKSRPLHQYLLIGLGIGFPYTMTSFYAMQEVQAAHAGVVVNGMLPVLGAAAAWIFLRQTISFIRYFGITIIFLANFLMAGARGFADAHIFGILLLFCAAIFYTVHIVAIKRFHFEWKEVLVTVPVVNALIFLPLWFLFPTNLAHASLGDISAQAFYQGILINVLAVIAASHAVKHLGPITVSIYMSSVPLITAILAWFVLNEALNPGQFVAIAGCSLGLFIYARGQILETRMQGLT